MPNWRLILVGLTGLVPAAESLAATGVDKDVIVNWFDAESLTVMKHWRHPP